MSVPLQNLWNPSVIIIIITMYERILHPQMTFSSNNTVNIILMMFAQKRSTAIVWLQVHFAYAVTSLQITLSGVAN